MSPAVAATRALAALESVLPTGANLTRLTAEEADVEVDINGTPATLCWIGEGWPASVRGALAATSRRPLVLVARRMSPGAQKAAEAGGAGWIDESGAAAVVLPGLVISRTGRPDDRGPRPERWTPAVVGVAEALLTGTRATVDACVSATGLSAGSCAHALKLLTDQGLLTAQTSRGPASGRQVASGMGLLEAYVQANDALRPDDDLSCGVLWRDPLAGLRELGERWDRHEVPWAATGLVASQLLAPLLTSGEVAEVLVEARSMSGLERAARAAGLNPITGGRLVLRPFTSTVTPRLSRPVEGLRVAPWPTVFADLRRLGVRGEDAADHLLEVLGEP